MLSIVCVCPPGSECSLVGNKPPFISSHVIARVRSRVTAKVSLYRVLLPILNLPLLVTSGLVSLMSDSKKKDGRALQQMYDSIKGMEKKPLMNFHVLKLMSFYSEILLTVKSQLDDPKPPTRPSLTKDLHRVASLAESFTEQRPKSNKSWVQFADSLDQEGQFSLVTCSSHTAAR